ncbi:hypothetical protein MASR2M78_20350 [Treponema sp.]
MQTKGNHIIGVDIGGTKTALSLWTRDARLLEKTKFATEGNADTVIARIVDEIRLLLSGAGLVAKEIIALGISCGGPLDSKAGLILSPPNLPTWDRIPIVERLESATGIRAHLENDANACALAEWYQGAGRGFDNVIFLTFGTGLGAGLILNGTLYRGACDLAGEVGHIRWRESGPLGYGKEGSWEGFCSGGGISRDVCDSDRGGSIGKSNLRRSRSRRKKFPAGDRKKRRIPGARLGYAYRSFKS